MNTLDRNLAEIYVAADEIEAKHIQLLLADNHIPSRIVGTGLIGGAGEIPPGWVVSPRIWVDKEYETVARQLVTNWEKDRKAQRKTTQREWTCEHCEAQVPGEFDICWQCQKARDCEE